MIWRSLPLVGLVALGVISFGVRPWLQRRRHGSSGILLFQSGRWTQNLRDAAFVIQMALLIGQAVLAVTTRHTLRPLIAGQGLPYDLLRIAGAILLVGGIVLLAVAQLNMGASWRVGIKEGEAPGLVVRGLYRFCRHPIYLGLLMALAGYVALLPTALSLVLLAAAYAGTRAQIATEEAYLERIYGDAFRSYARRVGRFLPGLGRR